MSMGRVYRAGVEKLDGGGSWRWGETFEFVAAQRDASVANHWG
jgi:hypothetical protein